MAFTNKSDAEKLKSARQNDLATSDALVKLRSFLLATENVEADDSEINVNPFDEAQGLTPEVESFEPSAAVASDDDVNVLVKRIDDVIASGNFALGRRILSGALQIIGTIKGLIT